MRPRIVDFTVFALGLLVVVPGTVLAHSGGLANTQQTRSAVPTWLFLSTGGGVIGASFLLTTFVTDRDFVETLHSIRTDFPALPAFFEQSGRVIGLVGLGVVLWTGFLGSQQPLENAAILLVWAGWWAGFTITVYLAGNSWPAINPLRTITAPFDEGKLSYPDRLGGWPRVVGLLAIVWIEVVSPLADEPRILATIVSIYLGISVAGAFLFGTETWFAHIDPITAVFRQYGKVAPIQRVAGRTSIVLPGARLISDEADDLSEVGLIIALIWGTTYDGFVSTPLWNTIASSVVGAGIPAIVLYPLVLVVGFVVFLGTYWVAISVTPRVAPTLVGTETIARFFAPPLLTIAAGYHLAHYLGYSITLSPALLAALLRPFRVIQPMVIVLPEWFSVLPVAFVLGGHLVAVWVAHSVAYRLFPSRLQAIRSQLPITLVMVCYTMVSLWIVTQPFADPLYV